MAEQYDVLVIGAGPGGYVCAIRAAQLGLKTACVDKRETLGGTCLNVGCIPSKALLHASEEFEKAGHHLEGLGIKVGAPALDLPTMMKHKDNVVEANTKGIDFLLKKNKIDRLTGAAELLGGGQVKIGADIFEAKHIVIATGSEVATLPNIEIDEKRIVSSTGALSLDKIPQSMVVIGGGVIGLELGTVWRRLGAKVTVVEFLDGILPGMDGDIRKEAHKLLKKQGVQFKLSSKVTSAVADDTGVDLSIEPAAGGEAETLRADIVLMAVGRKPYTQGLGLEAAGVKLNERGQIETDGRFNTNAANIYAIGDVIAGPMLAHKAEEEGVKLAEMLAGQWGSAADFLNHDAIPGVVYTSPEIASVGKTEEQLKDEGVAYNVGKFPFMANGRARAMDAMEGFVKILADAKTDRVLGAHMIGPNVGELISEIVTIMEFEGTAEDITLICHAHPTLSEVTKEAALAVHKRAIHS